MASIIGIEAHYKPMPKIILENRRLFKKCRNVLDIGAGRGRFVRFFLENFDNIEEYVAIEPFPRSISKLKEVGDDRLVIVADLWENVRDVFLRKRFDIVVFWDVLMFMDLSFISENPVEAAKTELNNIINITRKYFLFSLHPVKKTILPRENYREILNHLDNHSKLKLVAKKYLNRLYSLLFNYIGGNI